MKVNAKWKVRDRENIIDKLIQGEMANLNKKTFLMIIIHRKDLNITNICINVKSIKYNLKCLRKSSINIVMLWNLKSSHSVEYHEGKNKHAKDLIWS